MRKGRENMAPTMERVEIKRQFNEFAPVEGKEIRSLKGLMAGSNLTVDRFLEMTREHEDAE